MPNIDHQTSLDRRLLSAALFALATTACTPMIVTERPDTVSKISAQSEVLDEQEKKKAGECLYALTDAKNRLIDTLEPQADEKSYTLMFGPDNTVRMQYDNVAPASREFCSTVRTMIQVGQGAEESCEGKDRIYHTAQIFLEDPHLKDFYKPSWDRKWVQLTEKSIDDQIWHTPDTTSAQREKRAIVFSITYHVVQDIAQGLIKNYSHCFSEKELLNFR